MGQVKSIAVVGAGSTVQQAATVLRTNPELAKPIEQEKTPVPKKALTAAERRPDLYIRNQKLDAMSIKQIHGELRRVVRRQHIPREIQLNPKTGAVRGLNKEAGPLVDAVLGVVLKIMLDSHTRGMSPFPR